MAYESFYGGASYSLDPIYHAPAGYGDTFIGYRFPFKNIGAPTSVQTADQVHEVTNLLNQGMRHIELQPLNPELFDTIPKQHFKEIARMQKLAGAESSIHAPVVEPSGFGKEGWSEQERITAENQLKAVVDKAQVLNEKGFMPIVIHASAMQGSEEGPVSDALKKEYIQGFKEHYKEDPTKEQIDNLKYSKIIAINQETKQMTPIEREERIYPNEVVRIHNHEVFEKNPGEIKAEIRSPMEELETHNQSEWHQNLTQVIFNKNRGDEILQAYYPVVQKIWPSYFYAKDPAQREKIEKMMSPTEKNALDNVRGAYEYVHQSNLTINSLFSKAYKYGTEKEKEQLREAAKVYTAEFNNPDLGMKSKAIQTLAIAMEDISPRVWIPIEEFATDKSAQTFANVAWHAYKSNKKNPPVLAVENLFPGMGFSRSEQLKGLIDASRKKFEDNAVKNGYSRDEAKEIGKKIIGATWDVGHLNIQKKSGFDDKELIKETKNIAPYVKHVHLTDNFGFSDSHLPPGMGNVPIKGILEELEKKGFTGKGVVEAGNFAAQFKISPMPTTLEALGSPLYMGGQAPYWNQVAGTQGGYFSGYGPVFPETHFSLYGTGFSGMPVELGGQMPGRGSRMSGTPMD